MTATGLCKLCDQETGRFSREHGWVCGACGEKTGLGWPHIDAERIAREAPFGPSSPPRTDGLTRQERRRLEREAEKAGRQ